MTAHGSVIDLNGKPGNFRDVAGVFFFNAETFGDPISHYEKTEHANYEPGQTILFVNVNAVTSVSVVENDDA